MLRKSQRLRVTFSRAATSPNRNGKGAVPPPCWFLSACDRQRSRGAASPSRTQPAFSQRLSSTPPRLPSLPQRELIHLSIPACHLSWWLAGLTYPPRSSARRCAKNFRSSDGYVPRQPPTPLSLSPQLEHEKPEEREQACHDIAALVSDNPSLAASLAR